MCVWGGWGVWVYVCVRGVGCAFFFFFFFFLFCCYYFYFILFKKIVISFSPVFFSFFKGRGKLGGVRFKVIFFVGKHSKIKKNTAWPIMMCVEQTKNKSNLFINDKHNSNRQLLQLTELTGIFFSSPVLNFPKTIHTIALLKFQKYKTFQLLRRQIIYVKVRSTPPRTLECPWTTRRARSALLFGLKRF